MKTLADIDWRNWQAKDPATLVFVIRDGKILLIDKKTGFGKGKVNGPGGKLEPGESPERCAVRECHEELGIHIESLRYCGQHRFQFVDGYSLLVWVYSAEHFTGVPTETIEARPFWAALDEIPYERMWADDHLWLPMLIRGQQFSGRWLFDGDRMLDYELLPDDGTSLQGPPQHEKQ